MQTQYAASRDPVTFDNVQAGDPQSRIGRAQHPKILAAYGGAYSDPKLEQTLARIVGRLQATGDDPTRAYSITVLDSPNVNAFALPGGYVYVTRGLLGLARDSAEVAAVIGHEMGHVTANHGIERQQREEANQIASRVVSEILSSQTAGRQALAQGQLSLAQFSRQQELEADILGIQHIAKAGYDPAAASRFLEAMDQFSRLRNAFQATNPDLDFLASHPSAPERIQLARQRAGAVTIENGGDSDRDRYLAGIDGMLFGDTPSEGYVRGQTFAHPGLGIVFTVPEGFVLDNTTDAVLASGPNDTAIRFDSVSVPRTRSLSDYLASGWVGGLDRSSVRRTRVNGLDAVTATARGGDYAFHVLVVRVGEQVYRFLTAVPSSGARSATSVAQTLMRSFRQLSAAEKASLKPLRIRIVKAGAGDTVERMAGRMQGMTHKAALFRLLNGLETGEPVTPGRSYKIVAE